ncbi:MAG: ribonuclease III [Bacilli bacterium]
MELLNKLNIKSSHEELYLDALTHTSYANENNCNSYERLEYLGDAVLEVIISEYLYKTSTYGEGIMTKLRAKYVCGEANYAYALKLGLNEFLRLGRGEAGHNHKAIVADIFEGFIGALFLDKGFDYTKTFISDHIIPLIEKKEIVFETDYKSLLQEAVQTDKRSLEYVVVKETGPAHDRQFQVVAKINDIIYGKGSAHSKKEAEQIAACDALKKGIMKGKI